MARKSKLEIVREAIAIQGYIPIPGARGMMHVRAVEAGPGGVWLIDHYSEDLGSRLRIPRKHQDRVVGIAEGIIERKDEIRAERERSLQAFRDR